MVMSRRIRMLEDALLAEGCMDDDLLSPVSSGLHGPGVEHDWDESRDVAENGGTLGVTGSKENVFLGSVAIEVCLRAHLAFDIY